MNNAIRKAVLTAAVAGAQTAAASPNIAIERSAVGPVAESVANELAPRLEHLTNAEPWYLSRVTWGVLVALVCTMLRPITGTLLDEGQTQEIVSALAAGGQLFGLGFTLYGRWAAKKPIGN